MIMKKLIRYFIIVIAIFFNTYSESQRHFLSFIMPCFNCSKTVIESLDSIFKQQLRVPFEVICTDDGSTDNTRAFLIEYALEHHEMKVFVHKKNKGGGAARNTCVAHAQGDLIFCLDSDNILVPNSVQGLIDLIDITGAECAAFAEERFFKGRFHREGSWFFECMNDICGIDHLLKTSHNPASSGNYLYTKESFLRAGGYPEDRGALDTLGFGFRQCATGSVCAILPHSFYWHRQTEHSYFIREFEQGQIDYYSVFQEFPELFTAESLQAIPENKRLGIYIYDDVVATLKLISHEAIKHVCNAARALHKKDYKSASDELQKAIVAGATHPRVYEKLHKILYQES